MVSENSFILESPNNAAVTPAVYWVPRKLRIKCSRGHERILDGQPSDCVGLAVDGREFHICWLCIGEFFDSHPEIGKCAVEEIKDS